MCSTEGYCRSNQRDIKMCLITMRLIIKILDPEGVEVFFSPSMTTFLFPDNINIFLKSPYFIFLLHNGPNNLSYKCIDFPGYSLKQQKGLSKNKDFQFIVQKQRFSVYCPKTKIFSHSLK